MVFSYGGDSVLSRSALSTQSSYPKDPLMDSIWVGVSCPRYVWHLIAESNIRITFPMVKIQASPLRAHPKISLLIFKHITNIMVTDRLWIACIRQVDGKMGRHLFYVDSIQARGCVPSPGCGSSVGCSKSPHFEQWL